jgi:aldehyde:ferredoxin oxidoreductase
MCGFLLDMALPGNALENTASLMEAVTGLLFTPEEVQRVGERISNIAKAFNMRQGLTKADDTLPARLMEEPIKAGDSKGHMIGRKELDLMLAEYYSERGWDLESGKPSRAKLEALGLKYVADQLGMPE